MEICFQTHSITFDVSIMFCHFSLLSKLSQGNLEQRNRTFISTSEYTKFLNQGHLLEVFQSFQQHFVAFHDEAESPRRYQVHVKLKHVDSSLFFLSLGLHIYLSNGVKTKTEKGYLTWGGGITVTKTTWPLQQTDVWFHLGKHCRNKAAFVLNLQDRIIFHGLLFQQLH